MIFIASNVATYLVGAPHPHKADAERLVHRRIAKNERLVTDVAVPQEMLHRYVAIGRKGAIRAAFDALLGIVDEGLPVLHEDATRAKELLLGTPPPGLSARDALYVAVMRRRRIGRILTFDRAFDAFKDIERVTS